MSFIPTLPFHSGVLLPELLDRNFYCVNPHTQGDEKYLSTFQLVDLFVGLIKIPFILREAEEMERLLHSTQQVGTKALALRGLSLLSNCFEFLTWLGDRKIMGMGHGTLFLMRSGTFLGKTIFYSHVCAYDRRILSQIQHLEASPDEENERSIAQAQLASHVSYLACMSLSFANLTLGVYFPRHFLLTLHISSLMFDLIAYSLSEDEGVFMGVEWKQN